MTSPHYRGRDDPFGLSGNRLHRKPQNLTERDR